MKDEAVGELVGSLCDRYGMAPTDQMVTLWWNNYHETNQKVIDAALGDYLSNESYMPTVADFREYVDKHSRIARRIAPRTSSCATCDGSGWMESKVIETAIARRTNAKGEKETYTFTYPPGVYPCPTCEPARHDRWRNQWVPEARRSRPVKPTDTFDYNPLEKIADVRALLKDVGGLTKDAGGL